ncbi:MAG: hypothetical protein JKY95_00695 [Planctomycetaceae bacterium]|nr:hypothetical protein [Planctomycetaceae bacterium]
MRKQLHKSPWMMVLGLLVLLVVGFSMRGWSGTSDSNSHLPESQVAITESDSLADLSFATPQSLQSQSVEAVEGHEPVDPKDMSTEQVKKLVTGFWKSKYYGTRHLEIRDDGTATIYYEASMLARLVIGKQVLIQYDWEYDASKTQVKFIATSGEPTEGFDYIIDKWGKNQQQTVVQASQELMLLLDSDGETEHHWRRLDSIDAEVLKKFATP